MTKGRHVLIAIASALVSAAALWCVIFYAWLTAYYQSPALVAQARVRANVWLALFLLAAIGFVWNGLAWFRERRKPAN